jgi:hypothetical protein
LVVSPGNDVGGLDGLYVSGVENQYEGEVVSVCARGGLHRCMTANIWACIGPGLGLGLIWVT